MEGESRASRGLLASYRMRISTLLCIYKKEMKLYFFSPLAYMFVAMLSAISAWFYMRTFFFLSISCMRSYFSLLPWLYLLFVPALTGRAWAQEWERGTVELLFSCPVREWEAVLGKYLASITLLVLTLLLSFPLLLTVAALGEPDWGKILGGYLGTFFLGQVYIAAGLLFSAILRNQVLSFLGTVPFLFFFYIMGKEFFLLLVPSPVAAVLRYVGMSTHFENFLKGMVDTRSLIYFCTTTLFLLYVNRLALQRR